MIMDYKKTTTKKDLFWIEKLLMNVGPSLVDINSKVKDTIQNTIIDNMTNIWQHNLDSVNKEESWK